jgi:hypothetical protein
MQLAACGLRLATSCKPRKLFCSQVDGWMGGPLKTRADTGVENKLDGAFAVHVEPGV